MKFGMVQCDRCFTETPRDDAEGWLIDTFDRYLRFKASGVDDLCPRCADELALEES
jgi:hypothetical protein